MRNLRRMVGWLLAGCIVTPGIAHTATNAVRIGHLVPMTGPVAALGRDMQSGFRMYLDEIGNQAAGRQIEVITEDDEGQANVALTKTRRLVEQDRVHVIAGTVIAPMCYALAPYIVQKKVPYLAFCAADDVTQRKPNPYLIRTTLTSSQITHPFGEYVAKTLGYKRVVTVGVDLAYGWEGVGGFQKTFEDAGGRIIQKIWAPISVSDWSPYLAQIKRDADAVFVLVAGAYGQRFFRQYQDFGLKGKIPLVGHGSASDETVLPAMGDEILGFISALHYSAALATPDNDRFARGYRQRYGRPPSMYSENAYSMARWIVEGIKGAGGNAEDAPRLLEALRRVKIPDSPRGPLELDDMGNVVQNIYVRRVERAGDELVNRVIFSYPQVSQFWRYGKDDFLRQPVYARDYPACQFCE